MNWNDPQLLLSLQDLKENLNVRGRDSRVVRAAFAWSEGKKSFVSKLKQLFYKSYPKDPNRLKVLFLLNGGLGDAVCSKRVVSAYRRLLPQAIFEVYSPLPGVGEMLFSQEANTSIRKTDKLRFSNYDLVCQICLAVKFCHVEQGRLSRLAPGFSSTLERAQKAQARLGSLLQDPFLTEAPLGRWLASFGGRRFDLLSFTSGVELLHDEQERLPVLPGILVKFGLAGVQYVTFHDGTSHAQMMKNNHPTRSWPSEKWKHFCCEFKKKFPQIKLVQLGGRNSPVYPESDVSLVGKTSLTDIPALLAGACLHVDTESGLVHLSQYVDTKSVVLFGPSLKDFFAYRKNRNLSAGNCGGCMWSNGQWFFECPLGQGNPSCMESISVQQVLQAVSEELAD